MHNTVIKIIVIALITIGLIYCKLCAASCSQSVHVINTIYRSLKHNSIAEYLEDCYSALQIQRNK